MVTFRPAGAVQVASNIVLLLSTKGQVSNCSVGILGSGSNVVSLTQCQVRMSCSKGWELWLGHVYGRAMLRTIYNVVMFEFTENCLGMECLENWTTPTQTGRSALSNNWWKTTRTMK